MTIHYDFTCPFEKCTFHNRITKASQYEIKNHFKKQHDYTELLEKAVYFQFIGNIRERRSPDWLAQKFFDYTTNKVEENWL